MSLFVQSVYLSAAISLLFIFCLYRSNPLRRLPSVTITIAFTAGMLAVIPVSIVRHVAGMEGLGLGFSAYVRAGLVEEAVKFVALGLTVWRLRFPDVAEEIDIAIYCGVLGVGFGVYEDFWYMFGGAYDVWFGGDVVQFREVLRAITFARIFPGHIVFNGLAGFLVARAYFLPKGEWELCRRVGWLVAGFVVAVVAHGTFNVIAELGGAIPLATYVVALIGVFLGLRRRAIRSSPFKSVIAMVGGETSGEWPYPRPPSEYLFAEGFDWPRKGSLGMFQVFPLALSLVILYPMLVAGVYVISRLIAGILG